MDRKSPCREPSGCSRRLIHLYRPGILIDEVGVPKLKVKNIEYYDTERCGKIKLILVLGDMIDLLFPGNVQPFHVICRTYLAIFIDDLQQAGTITDNKPACCAAVMQAGGLLAGQAVNRRDLLDGPAIRIIYECGVVGYRIDPIIVFHQILDIVVGEEILPGAEGTPERRRTHTARHRPR